MAETDLTPLADIIKPRPGRIAVLVDTKDEITTHGIYIPRDSARSIHEARVTQGQVVAVGESVEYDSDDDDIGAPATSQSRISVGDHVLFGKFTGTRVSRIVGKDRKEEAVIIMNEHDVLATIVDPTQAQGIKVKA